METLCDHYDFAAAEAQPWFRVDQGMSQLTNAMHNLAVKRKASILYNNPVIAMEDQGDVVTVTSLNSNGHESTKKYGAVFNTTTFGALQRMDLSKLGLQRQQLTGIRALSYDRATKVAIKFKNPWWIPWLKQLDPKYKYGGVSSSDLSISNVVSILRGTMATKHTQSLYLTRGRKMPPGSLPWLPNIMSNEEIRQTLSSSSSLPT